AMAGDTLRVAIERTPEPGHVLAQLPQDEVAAVAPHIAAAGRVLGARKNSLRVARRLDERAWCVEAIFIWIAEQVFAETAEVEIGLLGQIARRTLAAPIEIGLGDAIDEPEGLDSVQVD